MTNKMNTNLGPSFLLANKRARDFPPGAAQLVIHYCDFTLKVTVAKFFMILANLSPISIHKMSILSIPKHTCVCACMKHIYSFDCNYVCALSEKQKKENKTKRKVCTPPGK